jgi:hypothetical protein
MCTASKALYAFGPLALATIISSACTPAQVAQAGTDVLVALKDVICVMDTYSTEVQGGVSVVQAGIDAASKCGVAQDVTSNILASHVAAEQREARPTTPEGGLVDAGAPVLGKRVSK